MSALRLAAASLALAVCGCAFPTRSHDLDDSRSNLGEAAPAALAPGRSSREDALLLLGEPDRRGIDDHWFAYDSARSLGGVVVFVVLPGYPAPTPLATHQTTRYRVLVLRFDGSGVIESARFAENVCPTWMPGDQAPFPCVDLAAGLEPVSLGDRLDARATLPTEPGERLLESFVSARWLRSSGELDGAAFVTDRAVYFLDREAPGAPVTRLVFRWSAAELREIDWTSDGDSNSASVVRVALADGRSEQLAFRPIAAAASAVTAGADRTRGQRFIDALRWLRSRAAR